LYFLELARPATCKAKTNARVFLYNAVNSMKPGFGSGVWVKSLGKSSQEKTYFVIIALFAL
jgi:hypothetical protein